MKRTSIFLLAAWLLSGCAQSDGISEYDRTLGSFLNEIDGEISVNQWWRTAVKINVQVTSDVPVRLWLTSEPNSGAIYDYKETEGSELVSMSAPQGYENPLYLSIFDQTSVSVQAISLTGKPEESVSVTVAAETRARKAETRASAEKTHPVSLCGNSVNGNPRYYEFNTEEMVEYHDIMEIACASIDAKDLGLNCDYEIVSMGPFYITWVDGFEASQRSHILGYFYHSPDTYEDIVYQDLCETHKWDYIDGLSKVQYQFDMDIYVDGHLFKADEWYDANFDLNDSYGSKFSMNMDRIGDDAYNTQEVYNVYRDRISALQGISFEINVPKGKHIGFYLRADEEPRPDQWRHLVNQGIRPSSTNVGSYKGTCFSIESWNTNATHRCFIHRSGKMAWIGMEDNVDGGDFDCNDLIFGLAGNFSIVEPGIPIGRDAAFPWTLAFEDVYRGSDYDFNDAVIKLVPDFYEETCNVYVMAAGSPARMFLHYSGPDGDYNLGEIHQLLSGSTAGECINTQTAIASVPFVPVASVPWPVGYAMSNDAQRFWIEVQRGTCADCTDVLSLPDSPGERMPQAILVAGEWKWPMEGVHIYEAYEAFPNWAKDATRTRYWEWYKSPEPGTYVSH